MMTSTTLSQHFLVLGITVKQFPIIDIFWFLILKSLWVEIPSNYNNARLSILVPFNMSLFQVPSFRIGFKANQSLRF